MNRRTTAAMATAAIALIAALCKAQDKSAERKTDELRYDEAQFKAAHNSIDRDESLTAQLDWDPKKPEDGGCRGVELDLVLDPASLRAGASWVFGVQHGGDFKPDTPRLEKCLHEIRAWSDRHPKHEVITLHLDLKHEATLGEDAEFTRQIESFLERELGRERIFRPGELQRDEPTLLAGATKHGWPRLADLRGKLIVVFSGEDSDTAVARRRKAYAALEPKQRLAFVDLDQRAGGAGGADECSIASPYYQEGSRVFVNLQLGRGEWQRLAREAHAKGFATREWKANDEESWRKAKECGVNVLSTDRVRGMRPPHDP